GGRRFRLRPPNSEIGYSIKNPESRVPNAGSEAASFAGRDPASVDRNLNPIDRIFYNLGPVSTLIILLGALTAFAPMSIDMYLPALPSLSIEFSADPGHVQLS